MYIIVDGNRIVESYKTKQKAIDSVFISRILNQGLRLKVYKVLEEVK